MIQKMKKDGKKIRCSNKDCKNLIKENEVAMANTKVYCQKCYPKFTKNYIEPEWTQERDNKWVVKHSKAMKKWGRGNSMFKPKNRPELIRIAKRGIIK